MLFLLDTVQMVAGLAKNCVLRITKQSMNFIIRERNAQVGAEAWCELEQASDKINDLL